MFEQDLRANAWRLSHPKRQHIFPDHALISEESALQQIESVPSVLESAATGEIADIYADIRTTLRTSVVNLVWRNLATMPGALQWAWATARPLYLGPATVHAEAIRRDLVLPETPGFSADCLAAAGIGEEALITIQAILDSYHHTNALALVVLSALLERYDPSATSAPAPQLPETISVPTRTQLPALPSMATLAPEVQGLIEELNGFGEDTSPFLIASMYRHLAHWPTYLALLRTMLAPLQAGGKLNALTESARLLGRAHGNVLTRKLSPSPPPKSLLDALASCRLFVEHPIARMTGICAIIRRATPRTKFQAES